MNVSTRCVAALLGLAGLTTFAADDGFVALFDGKSIDGWVKRGGEAKYAVEGGEVVGTSVLNTPNTFLCTPRDYADFVLEYEFKVDPRLNSGVQIRSQCFDKETHVKGADGKDVKVAAGRVHGYQIEIDNDPVKKRWWTAGLYEEGARGWIYPGFGGGDKEAFTKQGDQVIKKDDWNKVRVECIGDSIKTWLNGELRVEAKDARVPAGFIGLQVHGIGKDKDKEGTQVRWRNLRIKEIKEGKPSGETPPNTLTDEEIKDGWKLLWDGKSSDGWQSAKGSAFPDHGWQIKDGLLTILGADGKESRGPGDIVTKEKFSNFILKADFRITEGANSGIKYFVNTELNKGQGSAIGLEFQVLDDERHPDAKLGRDGNRTIGSLYDLITADRSKKVNPPGEWNSAMIVSNGKHVEHWLNGQKVVEYERGSEEFRKIVAISKYKVWPNFGELPEGPILLQDHGNTVSYKNIKIKVLK